MRPSLSLEQGYDAVENRCDLKTRVQEGQREWARKDRKKKSSPSEITVARLQSGRTRCRLAASPLALPKPGPADSNAQTPVRQSVTL